MRKVIGIDPGITTTGYGIVEEGESDPEVVTYGTLSPPAKKNTYQRLAHIYDGLYQVIDRFHPQEMAIEEAFFGKNARTAFVLGQARGVALLAATHQDLDCFEYAPRKIKLSVVGNGNASKEQVQYMVKSILSLSDAPKEFDITDALAAALCHLNQIRRA
ncbi:MAG: crossover junction endodeoxyribonuclease RuvC [Candidatus Neomarinimicrobiota bacterium]